MKDELSVYLNQLYNATYVPIHYFVNNELFLSLPSWGFYPEELNIFRNSAAIMDVDIDYFSTEDFLYIGLIRNQDTGEVVIIGPVTSIPLSEEIIKKIIKRYDFEADLIPSISEYFVRTPLFSYSQFLNILGLVYKEVNGKCICIDERFTNYDSFAEDKISEELYNKLIERKENENYHDTYYLEKEYYGYLESGNVNGLINLFKAMPSFTEGNVADNALRQAKNIFIASITLATRHAIAGGLDIETAYQLSDSYIQEVEKMSDAEQITKLNSTAVIDFTKRVAESKIPTGMSKDIHNAIQYISNHVNKDISVDEIAKELSMHRTTLSKKFKRELGFNISTYIVRRKLEEAKSLLKYTDKSISEISEYLCFSSQAYFQNVFKKKFGMTPKDYRKK